MDGKFRRDQLARETLEGYASGPDAPLAATAAALAKTPAARSLILVEGVSDQIAVETLAHRHQRDLIAEQVVVLPVGGAQAFARYLLQFGPQGANVPLAGLCDAGEERFVRRAMTAAGLGVPQTRAEMAELGFFVCVEDLEAELIRAAGRDAIESLLEAQGDLASLRTLQRQPGWRDKPFAAQMRRFLGAGARRKSRYARLLVETVPLDRIPAPLERVLRQSAG